MDSKVIAKEILKLAKELVSDSDMNKIEKLEGQAKRMRRKDFEDMSKEELKEEIDFLDKLSEMRRDYYQERNPNSIFDFKTLDLDDESSRRYNDLTKALSRVENADRGSSSERMKAKRLLRQNGVRVDVSEWNSMTWDDIEKILEQHDLSI